MCQFASARCLGSRWPYVAVLASLCRIGEACNPGPDSDFVLGTFNPSGLRGKAPYVVSHLAFGDIWAITETHLCSNDVHAFRAGLHFASSPFPYCIGGHPVPAQSNRKFHNAWRGVATLSKHLTRAVPTAWPCSIHTSARIMCTATLMQDVWITGATVYGEPEGPLYPNHKTHNEQLLQHAISQICYLTKGPRYVAGDWNVASHSIPAFAELEQAGFCDLQDIAAQRWGLPVRNTCKAATRKDYCYISRELQALLKEVHIEDDVFPNHAVLWGRFHQLGSMVPRQHWFTPQEFPWPKYWDVDPSFWSKQFGSCDQKYQALWEHIETNAVAALPFSVSTKARGRARTHQTSPVTEGRVSPLKKARTGDIHPQYVTATFRHSQWLRQTRRLQTYMRYVKTHGPYTEHARGVWGSILRATGFQPSFSEWWVTCQQRTHGAPVSIPFVPPDLPLTIHIHDTMVLAFREMECELHKASRQYAKLRREQNPNMIFRDLKNGGLQGVDILTRSTMAEVEEVRPLEQAVVLTAPTDFEAGRPIMCNGHELQVLHHDTDCLWVSDVRDIAPGMKLAQPAHVGSEAELFHMFLNAWKEMWARHQDVSPDRWRTILEFARVHLPRHHMRWNPLDAVSLAQCIAQKKSSTTAGLDGVTLEDLKAMPSNALQNFVRMFSQAECTGDWPVQVLAGRVTCIAKHEAPKSALDFRPITVFGLLFRCWGTYHAKKAIKMLEPALPVGLFGSRSQRFAGQIWSQVLWSIEMAYENGTPLCGVIADLRKAFNYLPREVVLEGCAIVGVPFPVLTAWAGALASMPRRFQIHGCFSEPAFSTCGLPEGCALSCLGMMVVDMMFHAWMLHFLPLCQPLSYVDDWQVLVSDPAFMLPAYQCLERFVDAMDMYLDHRKTSTWSLSAEGRGLMRTQGFGLVSACRNLGAHVQFTKQHTNKTMMERVSRLTALWPKLRMSAAPYMHKVRAILCAAWPQGLHGIAATAISQATYQTLRAGAMKGLKVDVAGANAAVHLGMVEKCCVDPFCWSILQTLHLTRECGVSHRVESVLADIAMGQTSIPGNSITHTLFGRIIALGWHVAPDGKIHDMIGSFSLFEISAVELRYRVERHWPHVVAEAVRHRPNFVGLGEVDVEATREWMQSLDPADQGLFRKVLNGTHITQDGKKHCQEAELDVCPFCDCTDSRYHRFWQCERFAHRRSHVTAMDAEAILSLPDAVTCCGWALAPSTRLEWDQYFVGLQLTRPPRAQAKGALHLFTDGSCYLQHSPQLRYAAWAVVQATEASAHSFEGTTLVKSGPLPGLLQSAVRAEVFAILRALQSSEHHVGPLFLWTDCAAVVRRMRKILAGHGIRMNSAHADLWLEIERLTHMRSAEVCITRVAAHQRLQGHESLLEEWCFRHNALVDKFAVQANQSRGDGFWRLHARHVHAVNRVNDLSRLIQRVQLDISKEIVSMEPSDLPYELPELAFSVPCRPWRPLPPLCLPAGAVRWYGDAMVRLISSWFWQCLHGAEGDCRWVSHYQLYSDFMMATGHPGPVHLQRWVEGTAVPDLALQGYGFKQRSRWFAKVLKETLRHMGVSLQACYGRPCSNMVLTFTGVVAVPWPLERLEAIDRWMLKCAGTTFRRQSKKIDALPFCGRMESFTQVYVSTIGM